MATASVGMEKYFGKALTGNDKMAGPGGIGSQLINSLEEKDPFGSKSKWCLVLPYDHLRLVEAEHVGKVYETAAIPSPAAPESSEGADE
ncbi:hypothetical protein CYMTET_51598 [Cymbomonas tetramitiformis]|uniref:Uncharacterized protein n=1 Tax=Cymbomonas tetramitiformis TaxID=36881 RepID=A0AAE0BKX8_9CHLO|nr:hypothetical protein CYMTET_51598 [Cymbomonas tetramitiformis]